MTELSFLPNPFSGNIVQHAWQSPADVPSIHETVFQDCLAGIHSARHGQPDSLIVYGPAGSGKTHLLTRLQRHLQNTAFRARDQVLHCVFVFVRLQTSPQTLWQHVRRRFAQDLMRRDEGLTQLQRLVAHQIAERNHTTPRSEVMRLRILGKEDHTSVSSHLSTLALELDLPRDLRVVLENLLCNLNVHDAASWLQGESLPERVLEKLGLTPEDSEDREDTARSIVTALARLAGGTLPIVFCFDQVEALQRHLDDDDAFFRFGRMAADLADADPNIFLLTCLQSGLLQSFKRSVREADLHRIGKRHSALHSLTREQVEALLLARLESAPALTELRKDYAEDPFYPLSQEQVRQLSQTTPCVARRVLACAEREFEQIRHGKAPPPAQPVEFLNARWEKLLRKMQAHQSPQSTSSTLLRSAEIISFLTDQPHSTQTLEGADVVFGAQEKIALSIRNEMDGRSLSPRLRQLSQRLERTDGARWVILRDPRLPISASAKRARETLQALMQSGVRFIEPRTEALSALAALASLLADAKSGDLTHEGEALSAPTVLDWLKSLREDPRLTPLLEFTDELFRQESPQQNPEEEQDLAELLSRERVLPLEQAAQLLQKVPEQLLNLARTHPTHFFILEGPPVVLVDRAGITAEVEIEHDH